MKIGEVARRAGIRTSAIRFYEKAGILPAASRQNGQRHFASEVELQLAVIEIARKAGFTIAEIKLLFHGFREGAPASARWRRLARKKYEEIEVQIARLKDMQELLKKGMRCNCAKLTDCGRILVDGHGTTEVVPSRRNQAAARVKPCPPDETRPRHD